MKLRFHSALFAIILASTTAHATHVIQHGFVVLSTNYTGNTFFDTDFDTGNPDFTNTVATIRQGQSILLGGEVETTRGFLNNQETAADIAAILYSFDNVTFSSLNLPKVVDGNPDRWQQANSASMAEIGAALPVGTNTLYIRFSATDNNHPVAPGLTTYLPSFTNSYSAQIEVLPQIPTPDGADEASGSPYINDGWQAGDGAFGTTFGAWALTGTSGSSSDNGFFLGSSTNNATSGDGGIDSIYDPGPPGGPTTNVAWGIYANNGNTAVAYRPFAGAMSVRQEFELAMDNGNIDTGGYVGFVLRNGNDTTSKNTGQRFEFLFAGGETTYKYIDRDGIHDTGVGFTGGGLAVRFILTSADTFVLRVFKTGDPTANFSGRLAGATGTAIESFALYNQNAGSGASHDAFFNKLLLTTGIAPQPRITAINILNATNAVINFESVGGALHEIQKRDDIGSGTWTTFTNNISSLGGVLQVNDWFGTSQDKRFYRLKLSE